jgi:hypothetical protein
MLEALADLSYGGGSAPVNKIDGRTLDALCRTGLVARRDLDRECYLTEIGQLFGNALNQLRRKADTLGSGANTTVAPTSRRKRAPQSVPAWVIPGTELLQWLEIDLRRRRPKR